jgi:invasion protein IalB
LNRHTLRLKNTVSPQLSALIVLLLWPLDVGAQTTRSVSKAGDWTVYAHDGKAQRICFVTAQPRSTDPKSVNRDPVHFFVSGWPKDGVRSEVSIKLGYPAKKDADVSVTVGTTAFRLFASNDRAFVADPTEELKLIEALKKGSSMIVQATSERGTVTRDTYSLQGLSQALQAMLSGCS